MPKSKDIWIRGKMGEDLGVGGVICDSFTGVIWGLGLVWFLLQRQGLFMEKYTQGKWLE
jgi:hypothetical protein